MQTGAKAIADESNFVVEEVISVAVNDVRGAAGTHRLQLVLHVKVILQRNLERIFILIAQIFNNSPKNFYIQNCGSTRKHFEFSK